MAAFLVMVADGRAGKDSLLYVGVNSIVHVLWGEELECCTDFYSQLGMKHIRMVADISWYR